MKDKDEEARRRWDRRHRVAFLETQGEDLAVWAGSTQERKHELIVKDIKKIK
jgi:hypothetical protein